MAMKKIFMLIIAAALALPAAAQTGTPAASDAAAATASAPRPEPVDLGLSVKWASCNLGATAPEGYGDYYSWAETKVKDDYSWSSYSQTDGDNKHALNKYTVRFALHYVMEPEDDAARVLLGGGWRMPTDPEMRELQQNCDWVWSEKDGVKGYKVTSRINGNSIFLPAAGYMEGKELIAAGSGGRYWTTTRHPYYAWCAQHLFFSIDNQYVYFYGRYRGYSIRPIYTGD